MKMILYIVVASMSWAFTRGHWLFAGFGLKELWNQDRWANFGVCQLPKHIWLWFSNISNDSRSLIFFNRYSARWKVAEALLKCRELTCERSGLMAHFELVFTHNRPSSFCVHWTIDLLLKFFFNLDAISVVCNMERERERKIVRFWEPKLFFTELWRCGSGIHRISTARNVSRERFGAPQGSKRFSFRHLHTDNTCNIFLLSHEQRELSERATGSFSCMHSRTRLTISR